MSAATAATAKSSSKNHKTQSSSSDGTFLSPENLCGQTLLSLVGDGHSLLADVRILSERVPPAFWAASDIGLGGGINGDDGKHSKKEKQSKKKEPLFNIFGSSSSSESKDVMKSTDEMGGSGSSSNNDVEEARKYAPFLFDFSYLHNPEEYEASLSDNNLSAKEDGSGKNNEQQQRHENDSNILELEREFAINHRQSIGEYIDLFYSIYDYQRRLNKFVEDLTRGYYIQYTVESVLLDLDGRALLCEAVWLYGLLLIVLERLLPVSLQKVSSLIMDSFSCENILQDCTLLT